MKFYLKDKDTAFFTTGDWSSREAAEAFGKSAGMIVLGEQADMEQLLAAATPLMDDDLREELHQSGDYDNDPAGFLREYCKLHEAKYGEAFCF